MTKNDPCVLAYLAAFRRANPSHAEPTVIVRNGYYTLKFTDGHVMNRQGKVDLEGMTEELAQSTAHWQPGAK